MNYGLAFTFLPNSSKEWISKAAMGVVFALISLFGGIGSIALAGWAIAIARHVINGDEDVLPEWSELGPIFIDGLKFMLLIFLWFIPFWILFGVSFAIENTVVNVILWCCSLLYGIPFSILLVGAFGMLASDRSYGEALNPLNAYKVVSANWAASIITWLLALIGYSVSVVISIALCGIGIILGITYGTSLAGHLYGQLYRESLGGKAAVV